MMALCLGEDTCLCHNHIDGFEFDGSSDFSIEIRFVLKSVTNGHLYSDNSTFDLGISNGNLYFDAISIGRVVQSLDFRIENEVMYYVAVVYNKKSLTLFLNGVELGKSEISTAFESSVGDSSGKPFKIGGGLNILIPSLRIVVGSLSLEEIKSNFFNGLSDRNDVIFWGDFSDVQYRDKSPNNLPLYADGGWNVNCRNICACIRLDGNGGFVDTQNYTFDAAYSVLCKFYPDYCTTHKMQLFSCVSTSEQKNLFSVVVDSEDSAKYICIQASDNRTDKVFIPDDMWIDVAVVVENNVIKLFVDGEFKTSLNASFAKTQCQLLVGVSSEYRKYGFKDAFVGYLGYIALFDVALSSDEIAIYAENQPYMFEHGLIANYIFTGNDIIDVTTGNRMLTVGSSKSVYEPALNPVSAETGIDLRIPTEICAEWNALSSYEKWQVSTAMDCVRNVYGQCYGIPMDTTIPIEQTAFPQIRRRYADIFEVIDGYELQDINVVAEEIASLATATAGVGSVAAASGKTSADGSFLLATSTLTTLFATMGVVLMPVLTNTVVESISDDENDKPSNDKASLQVLSLCANHEGDPTVGSIHFHSDVDLSEPRSMEYQQSDNGTMSFDMYLIAPELREGKCLCVFCIQNIGSADFIGQIQIFSNVFGSCTTEPITIGQGQQQKINVYMPLNNYGDALNNEIIILEKESMSIYALQNGTSVYLTVCKGNVFISKVRPEMPWRLFKANGVTSEPYDSTFGCYPSLYFIEHVYMLKPKQNRIGITELGTIQTMMQRLNNIFDSGYLVYDTCGATKFTNNMTVFRLADFQRSVCEDAMTEVNCTDCANIATLVAANEGVMLKMCILLPVFSTAYICNQIISIGDDDWARPFHDSTNVNSRDKFSYHQMCCFTEADNITDTSPIYDLCLKIDSDEDPNQDYCDMYEKVPFLSGGYRAFDVSNGNFNVVVHIDNPYNEQFYRERLVSNGQNAVFAPHLAKTTFFENNHTNAMYEYFIGHIIKNYHLDTLKLSFTVHYNVVEKLLDEVFQYREHPTEWYGVFNNTDCRIKLHRADDEKRSIRLLADTIAQYSCAFDPKRLIGINTDLFVGINMVITLFGGHIMIVNTDTDTSFKLMQLLYQNIDKYED